MSLRRQQRCRSHQLVTRFRFIANFKWILFVISLESFKLVENESDKQKFCRHRFRSLPLQAHAITFPDSEVKASSVDYMRRQRRIQFFEPTQREAVKAKEKIWKYETRIINSTRMQSSILHPLSSIIPPRAQFSFILFAGSHQNHCLKWWAHPERLTQHGDTKKTFEVYVEKGKIYFVIWLSIIQFHSLIVNNC